MSHILAKVKWLTLGRRVRSETKNREVHQPLVSLYRWWARRPHALMGAILDAARHAVPKGSIVGDPFSGGGTVAIESAARGYKVYAQDLHPWSAWGLKVSLTVIDVEEFQR